MTNVTINKKEGVIDKGIFVLLEFLISEKKSNKIKNALLLGKFSVHHKSIIKKFGFKINEISEKKINSIFYHNKFKMKHDVVICNHIIQYQRNTGFFLDKIFDILNEKGVLVISGPKNSPEQLIEGQISTCILPVFIQNLIYSGFDCKKGKMMSLGLFENSFIVPKEKGFDRAERNETGFKWSNNHRKRSPFELTAGKRIKNDVWFFNNCEVWKTKTYFGDSGNLKEGISINYPEKYKFKDIQFNFNIHKDCNLIHKDTDQTKSNNNKQSIML
tara:strand:- start:3954 stop:4772 length:819 start_codon:yes stop_codon:yes gene_type:complete